VPEVFAVWAAAVKVTVVVTAEADVGETLPTLNASVMPLYVIVDDTAVRPL